MFGKTYRIITHPAFVLTLALVVCPSVLLWLPWLLGVPAVR